MKPYVVFVDDDSNLRQAVVRSLRNQPYRVLSVDSAQSCLKVLEVNEVNVVVSDLTMPGMNGSDLVNELKLKYPRTVRLVLSGDVDTTAALDLINRGQVFRCLVKPCPMPVLASAIREALRYHDMVAQTQRLLSLVKSYSAKMSENCPQLAKSTKQYHLDETAPYDLASLIRNAVDEVERLDRALTAKSDQGGHS